MSTALDGTPRIQDLKVAEALGFANRHMIRKLICRHSAPLERFGEVISTVEKTSERGGRPGKAYWLNKKQALYICTKSETARATEVTIQMVEVYDAYLSGKTVHVRDHTRRTSTRLDDAIRLRTNIDRLERATAAIATMVEPRYLTAMVVNGEPVVVDVNDWDIRDGGRAVVLLHGGQLAILRPTKIVLGGNRFGNDHVSREDGFVSYMQYLPHGERSAWTPLDGNRRSACVIVGRVIERAAAAQAAGETRLLDTPAGRAAARKALPSPAIDRYKRDTKIRKMAIAGLRNKEIAETVGVPYSIAARVAGETRKVRARSAARVAG